MMKVEIVYLLGGLLRLITFVDLMFSMISLILNPTTMLPRRHDAESEVHESWL